MLLSINDDCFYKIISFLDITSLLKMKTLYTDTKKNQMFNETIEKYTIKTKEEKQELFDYFSNYLIKQNEGFEGHCFLYLNKKLLTYREKDVFNKNIDQINNINIEKFDKLTNYHSYSTVSYKNFDIDEIELYAFLRTMENLKGFTFYYLTKITFIGLYNFLKTTKIEHIRLVNCSIDDKDYYHLIKLLPEIKITMTYNSTIYCNIQESCDMMKYY